MRARHVIAAVAIVFFSLPIALRVVGVKAHEFENHAFAPAPKLSQSWDLFPQTTRYFTDRMPLREQAVTADRHISETVFGTNPVYGQRGPVATGGAPAGNPALNIVTPGKSGWLYVTESLTNICKANRPITVEQANRTWATLQRSLARPGKRVLVVVLPDKDAVYPEYLPDSYPEKDCLPGDRDDLWRTIGRAGPDFLPMRSTLLAAKASNRQPIYLTRDSHWNDLGALASSQMILKALGGPAQMKGSELAYGSQRRTGDLEATLNFKKAKADTVPTVKVSRAPTAPKDPGSTVLIGDSFASFLTGLLSPYFDGYSALDWNSVQTIGNEATTAATARRLLKADTVIIEVGERHYLELAKPTDAKKPGPTGIVVPNINYLIDAIRAQRAR